MTKLKNVRIVIMKVLTHVRTHPEELLVSKIWISCFLFRLRLLARVKRKESSCNGRNGNTFQHCNAQLFGCLKNNKTKRYYDRNFHGKAVSKDKRKGLPTQTWSINPLCGGEIILQMTQRQHSPAWHCAAAWGLKNNKTKNASCKVLGKQYRLGGKKKITTSTSKKN